MVHMQYLSEGDACYIDAIFIYNIQIRLICQTSQLIHRSEAGATTQYKRYDQPLGVIGGRGGFVLTGPMLRIRRDALVLMAGVDDLGRVYVERISTNRKC